MDLELLGKLMEMLEDSDLAELEIEEEGARIRLKKQDSREGMITAVPAMIPGVPSPAGVEPAAPPVEKELSIEDKLQRDKTLHAVRSPMVGTFYRAAAPDADPFVTVGDRVGPDAVVCIVEAMKIMNDIKAEVSGVVEEVLVNNTDPVEYNQPLFLVRLDEGV